MNMHEAKGVAKGVAKGGQKSLKMGARSSQRVFGDGETADFTIKHKNVYAVQNGEIQGSQIQVRRCSKLEDFLS